MRVALMLKRNGINVEWNIFLPEIISQHFGNFTGKFTSLFEHVLFKKLFFVECKNW